MSKKKYRKILAHKLCVAAEILNARADQDADGNAMQKYIAKLNADTAWCYSIVANWLKHKKKVKLA
jgi:hypothetical protein